MSAVADGVGRAVCALTGAWRGEAAEQRSGQRREIAEAERGKGSRERDRAERQHRRWYCTAEYCGRGGSRHFREIEEKSPGYLVFVSATLLICLPFKKIV